MEDLGLLSQNFGIRPQGKSNPMASSRSSSSSGSVPTWNKPDRVSSSSPPSIDSIFDGFKDPATKLSSMPVYDKPVYDDDIFVGVPGVKSSSSSKYVDVFASLGSGVESGGEPPYEDLLENLGRGMPDRRSLGEKGLGEKKDLDASGFEDLLPGFGGTSQKR